MVYTPADVAGADDDGGGSATRTGDAKSCGGDSTAGGTTMSGGSHHGFVWDEVKQKWIVSHVSQPDKNVSFRNSTHSRRPGGGDTTMTGDSSMYSPPRSILRRSRTDDSRRTDDSMMTGMTGMTDFSYGQVGSSDMGTGAAKASILLPLPMTMDAGRAPIGHRGHPQRPR